MRQSSGQRVCLMAKTDLIQDSTGGSVQCNLMPNPLQEPEGRPAARLDRQRHVLKRGEAGNDAGDLERPSQTVADTARQAPRGDITAGETDCAAVRSQRPADQVYQRRLARSVWPDDRVSSA
ncbi:MAG: hypothetical protein JWQ55_2050 [Rhodopila sp.]|nr:hypothetical protein [Rhodopila sp.]